MIQSPFVDFVVWAKPQGRDYLLDLVTPREAKAYVAFVDDSEMKSIHMEIDN